MHSKKCRRPQSLPPYIDPLFAEELSASRNRDREKPNPKADHKTQQLCRQVERILSLALSGECHDDLLCNLLIESVTPCPNASRLLVRLILPQHVSEVPIAQVMDRLNRASGLLRRSVAQAITRKRAPELSFWVIPGKEVQP